MTVMVIRAQNTEATFFDTHFKTRVREDLIPVPIFASWSGFK